MATTNPPQPDPRDVQRLIDLYQQVDRLNQSQAESMARIAASAGNINKEINRLERELSSVSDSFSSIAQSLKDSVQEFSRYNTTASNTKKTFTSLQSISSKLLSDQSGYSRLSEKELKKLQEKLTLDAQNLAQNIASGNLTAEQAVEASDALNRAAQLNDLLDERLKKEKEITKATGVTGNALKALSKIPGIGDMLKTEDAIADMKELADSMKEKGEDINTFSNRLKIAGTGLKTAFGGIKESLTDPVSIILFFTTQALKANRQTVELGKSLGYAGSKADDYREKLVGIESLSTNINVTTENLAQAFSELAQSTGFAYEFTADQLTTQIKLTKQVGLQAEDAAQIQRYAVLNGKTSEETYRSFVKGLVATRNQLKVGIDFKASLSEALKVSGQLAAQLGYNPKRIAEAIVTAKAFGMTLEQVAKSGESLLNFEQSLESELKAELLTGKQLNLERARAAALAGDQATLAEEIAKNVGTAADFAKMNTLQQKALAESVGMTADELANTLRRREEALDSGKSLAQVTEEEAAKALERQAIQDKFNQGILKLQSLIGNILAGPLGSMLDVLVNILDVVNLILQPFTLLANLIKESTAASVTFLGVLGAIYTIKNRSLLIDKAQLALESIKKTFQTAEIGQLGVIQSIKSRGFFKTLADAAMTAFKSVASIPYVGPILGAAAAASAVALGMKLFSKGDDIVSPGYGKRVLSTPEGSIALNDKDTVIAGTNLGGGDGGGMPSIDLSPMIVAINEVRAAVDRLYNKDTTIDMDSRSVGTTLSQKTTRTA